MKNWSQTLAKSTANSSALNQESWLILPVCGNWSLNALLAELSTCHRDNDMDSQEGALWQNETTTLKLIALERKQVSFLAWQGSSMLLLALTFIVILCINNALLTTRLLIYVSHCLRKWMMHNSNVQMYCTAFSPASRQYHPHRHEISPQRMSSMVQLSWKKMLKHDLLPLSARFKTHDSCA